MMLTRKAGLLIVFALLTVIIATWLYTCDTKLATASAPMKIVSLELAWTPSTAGCIVDSWQQQDLVTVAQRSILIDYVFIIFYTATLVLAIFVFVGPPVSIISKLLMAAAVAAGLCDVIENIFMQQYLHGGTTNVMLFSLPASVKFVLLSVVFISFMVVLYRHVREKLAVFVHTIAVLRVNAAGLVILIVSYFLFINLSQGQDVVMQVAEYSGPLLFSIFSVIFTTHTLWYSARLVQYERVNMQGQFVPEGYLIHVPRLISFNIVVVIQAAIFSLPSIAALSELQLWIFVVFQNGIYVAWHFWLTDRKKQLLLWVVIATCLAYGAANIFLMSRATSAHQTGLPIIAITLFLYSLLIVWYFVRRREELIKKTEAHTNLITDLKVMGVKLINLPVAMHRSEQSYFTIFNLFSLAGIFIYVMAFVFMGLDDRMGPFAFALLAFGVLGGLSNMITVYSIRKRTNFFVLLLVVAIIVGRFYDPYAVRLESCGTVVKRPSLVTYFDSWVKQRKPLIDQRDTFPVYLVIADGGASRSGYWVASVLSALQDSTIVAAKGIDTATVFSDHLLCLAGASGGSVGNATFYSLLKEQPRGEATFLKRSTAFLKQDFLTPVLTHWLAADLIQHFIPMPFIGDRAVALEQAMQYFSGDSLYASFGKPYYEVIDATGALPILFINATHVQGGSPAVVSSVDLDGFSRRVDIIDSVHKQNGATLFYSTAVALGARFPYVSPAGRIGEDYFVDGGYFDNTGAGIVHEMMQALDSLIEKADNPLYKKLRFSLLYISNYSLKADSSKRIHPLVNDLAAPLLTVFGTYSSQTSVNNERLVNFMRTVNPITPIYEVNLYTRNDSIEYPMNWVISDYNLDRMNKRATQFMDAGFREYFRLE